MKRQFENLENNFWKWDNLRVTEKLVTQMGKKAQNISWKSWTRVQIFLWLNEKLDLPRKD